MIALVCDGRKCLRQQKLRSLPPILAKTHGEATNSVQIELEEQYECHRLGNSSMRGESFTTNPGQV